MEEKTAQNPNPTTPTPTPVVEPEKQSFLNSKWLKIGIVILILIVILGGSFILGGKLMDKPQTLTPTATPTLTSIPTRAEETSQSFLEIPEYGVKFALSESIKDAYYLPATADKGYVYLKVHSLDSEPQCAKDESSTAALSRVGKNDINEMSGQKYSDSGNGVVIGNYYYYIDLAQYSCAESTEGKAKLEKVRTAFTNAEITQ